MKYLTIFANDQRICGCEIQNEEWNADANLVIEKVLSGLIGAFLSARDLKKEDAIIQDLEKTNITYQVRDLEEGKNIEKFRIPDGFWSKIVKVVKGVVKK